MRLGAAIVLCLCACKRAPEPAPTAASGREQSVAISGMRYSPYQLDVSAGDTIVWTNQDLVPHTVTAVDRSFDSGSIAPNATWSYVARAKGRHDYTCTFHPTMTATFTVK